MAKKIDFLKIWQVVKYIVELLFVGAAGGAVGGAVAQAAKPEPEDPAPVVITLNADDDTLPENATYHYVQMSE